MNINITETTYFQMLVNEYHLIPEVAKQSSPKVVQVLDELIAAAQDGSKATWSGNCAFEVALVHLFDKERLLCKLDMVVDKYRELVGEKRLVRRLRIKPADWQQSSDIQLRTQLGELLTDIHDHIELYAASRKSRNAILWRIVLPMSLLFLGFIAWMGVEAGEIPPIVYVIVAGSIGAMVSMIRRIQSSNGNDCNLLSCIDLAYDRLNIYLAPAYGSVFSVVLLLFFTSKLVSGDIFPNIVSLDKELADNAETVAEVMMNFIANTYPETGIDCAKLIIWSFIAGFAEKFVPDTLDRLVERGEKKQSKKDKTSEVDSESIA